MDKEQRARLARMEVLRYERTLSYGEEQELEALRRIENGCCATRVTETEKKIRDRVNGARSASGISPARRPTLREAMSIAAKQIDLDGFMQGIGEKITMGPDYQLAKTLCLVMAEVYMTDPTYVLYVCGMQMPAKQAQDVYLELTGDHIECLVRKIQQRKSKAVQYQRPYLRTMLYNVVFEYEAQTQAGISADVWEI